MPASTRTPLGLAGVIAAVIGLVIWAPWGRTAASEPSTLRPSPAASPGAATPAAVPASSVPAGVALLEPSTYTSITDNEWTIVALLRADAGPSTDEPAGEHPAGPLTTETPFQVLQQGAMPYLAPVRPATQQPLACDPSTPTLDRPAVLLPAGRVVYLGVTFPEMNRSAIVTASAAGQPTTRLSQAGEVAVRIGGSQPWVRSVVPTTGPGAVILFAQDPPQVLPARTWEFDVRTSPGESSRFLYACVGA